MLRRWLQMAVLSALVGLFGAAAFLSGPGAQLEESEGLGWLFRMRGPLPPPDRLAIVAIDGNSAERLGIPRNREAPLQEWSREWHAELIDRLAARGAAVIVFDLLFRRPRTLDEDSRFADAIARAGNVLLAEYREQSLPDGARISEASMPLFRFAEMALGTAPFVIEQTNSTVTQIWSFFEEGWGVTPNLPVLALQVAARPSQTLWEAALRKAGSPVVGLTSLVGVEAPERFNLRELVREYRRALSADPALADRLADALKDLHPEDAALVENSRLLPRLLRVYRGTQKPYLNHYGPPGTITTLPYAVFVGDQPAPAADSVDLHGAAVFVGVSDLERVTNRDYFATVFTGETVRVSGVELAATAFANMRDDMLLRQPLFASVLLAAAFGFFLCLIVCRNEARMALPMLVVATAGYALAAQFAFNNWQLWLPLAIPVVLQAPLAVVTGTLFRLWKHRRIMEKVIPVDVDAIDDRFERVLYKGPATCLYADAEGYTGRVDALGAEAGRTFMNDYFAAIAQVLKPYNVDFLEFWADNVLCAWFGVDAEQRERAGKAALATIQAVDAFNAEHGSQRLGVRIGLTSGTVVYGSMGAGNRYAFRLVGNPVSAAARLQNLCKQVGTRVLAVASVTAGIDRLLTRPLGSFAIHGFAQPISIVEVLGQQADAPEAAARLAKRFTVALAVREAGRQSEADALFAALLSDFPEDGPSRYYLRGRPPTRVAE